MTSMTTSVSAAQGSAIGLGAIGASAARGMVIGLADAVAKGVGGVSDR